MSAFPRALASSAVISTTSRPPPSSGTRITMPRPSLVTSRGPSPVRGFMAAIACSLRLSLPGLYRQQPPIGAHILPHAGAAAKSNRSSRVERSPGRVGCRLGRLTDSSIVRARSALFDVYGSYLRARGGSVAIAALVRLLEPLDFGAPAIRTAVSRMVRQGWLAPVRLPDGPGYMLTPRGQVRLDEAGARIYRTQPSTWDGRWHMVVLEELPVRHARERLSSSLRLLGYGPLGPATWIAPRPSPELGDVLDTDALPARVFHAAHDGDDVALAGKAWDL